MACHHYMPIVEFCNKHSISTANLYTSKFNGKFGDGAFKGKLIDENFFIRRQDFKKKIWLQSHDNYYFLIKHLTQGNIASMLGMFTRSHHSWNTYMGSTLFCIPAESIINYKLSGMDWDFIKTTNIIIKKLFVKLGVEHSNRNIAKILDKE